MRPWLIGTVCLVLSCGGDGPRDAGGDADAGMDAAPDGGMTEVGCETCTTLVGGLVFDGAALRPGAVVIDGERIVSVVFDETVVVTAGETITLEGDAILPGLVDMHVHLNGSSGPRYFAPSRVLLFDHLATMLRHGVTSFVDLGSSQRLIAEVERRLDAGALMGPRMFAAGPMLTAEGGHPCLAGTPPLFDRCIFIESEEDVAPAFDTIDPAPGDLVKVIIEGGIPGVPDAPEINRIDVALLPILQAEAVARGARLIAHVGKMEDMEAALDAGITAFAHAPMEELITPAFAARAATDGAVVVPTLVWSTNPVRLARGEYSLLDDPALTDDIDPAVIEALKSTAFREALASPEFEAYFVPFRGNAMANAALLIEAGVTLAAGTDAGDQAVFHGIALREELTIYVEELGMTPANAILTATRNAADLLGQDDLGRIEAGAFADLFIVAGDPTVDIHALEDITMVIANGEVVDRAGIARFGDGTLERTPVRDVRVDGSCVAHEECVEDSVCTALFWQCTPICDVTTHEPCAPGDACVQFGLFSWCAPGEGCDLIAQDCINGAACQWFGNGATVCWVGGPGVAGDPCPYCAPGFQCDDAGVCYQLCDPGAAPSACPAGQTCTDLSDEAGVTVGRCD